MSVAVDVVFEVIAISSEGPGLDSRSNRTWCRQRLVTAAMFLWSWASHALRHVVTLRV